MQLLREERGIALPMALLALLVLSTLVIAFAVLAASEPAIATNQLQVAQARAVAESGVERAIWALNNPADTNGIPNPLVTPAAPYDGSTTTAVMKDGVQVGVFTVSVTNGTVANERVIVATGWVPSDTAANKVKQRIQVSVLQFLFSGFPPPAALTVRGEIGIGGNTLIDSRSDTSCGNNAANQATDVVQNVPDTTLDQYMLTNKDLTQLKKLAQANGTYYQGTVLFDSGNQLNNGIVFVDTVSGNNIDVNGANTTAT